MVEEEREEAVGNLKGVVYAVTVKTDVEIIDGNLLRQISTACSFFLHWSGTIVRGHRLQASVSRLAKRWLESTLYIAALVRKAKFWNENNPIMVKQQRMFSSETFSNLALFVQISHML